MTERRVAKIMAQSDGFGQILVEPQGFGNRACDLGDLQRMGQPRAVMVTERREKNLCLMLEPAEGLAVDDPVSVPLESRPEKMRLFWPGSSL